MEDLTISIIQSDLVWEDIDANLANFEKNIDQIDQPVDLILLPEMFTTGFSMNPQKLAELPKGRTFEWMHMMAEKSEAVVGGSYMVNEGEKYFNRFYSVYPDGSFSKYDKKHLFGLAGEDGDYEPGVDRAVYEVKGWRILSLICYDLRFPVWARSQHSDKRLYEYDLITFSANWPSPRIHAWDTLLQARAIENIAYCAGISRIGRDGAGMDYPGHSAVYDYLGSQMIKIPDIEGVRTVSLSASGLGKFRARFPFQVDADKYILE